MSRLIIEPAKILKGELRLPGDKSISHRAVIFGAISHGKTVIRNLLEGEDVLRTVRIFKDLGVRIEKQGDAYAIYGRGPGGLRPSPTPLYCGNSGTTLRLMSGVLAALPFESVLTGDASLDRRPMDRVIVPLREMGARVFEEWQEGRRFIHLCGTELRTLRYRLPVPSAQVKSALLLAGLVGKVTVRVLEPVKTRDHTERMSRFFRDGRGKRLTIPGDPSSAAFFIVGGLVQKNSRGVLLLKNVLLNPTRTGFLRVLKEMKGRVKIHKKTSPLGEPIGDISVSPSSLVATTIGGRLIPTLIDEIPILAVAASCAKGRSLFRNVGELRVKESDRIRSIVTEFSKFGLKIVEKENGFDLFGGSEIKGATARSHGDHRIAMSLAILATISSGKSRIHDVDCIQTSFPGFVPTLKKIGGIVSVTH